MKIYYSNLPFFDFLPKCNASQTALIFILKGRLWLSITGDTEDDNFSELKIMSSLSLHNAASKKKKIVNVILLNGEGYQVTVDVSRSIDTH